MSELKVMFSKKQASHYFAKNIIDMTESPKLDSFSILEKYEYDLDDIIAGANEESND